MKGISNEKREVNLSKFEMLLCIENNFLNDIKVSTNTMEISFYLQKDINLHNDLGKEIPH